MAFRATVLSMMIASPSDVVRQRDDVRQIVNDWNFVNGLTRQVMLMPVGWETHAAPDLGGRAQGLINKRLLEHCDLLVGIFWTKLGTPTGDFDSGTVEEITRHVDAGRPAMVYFSDTPVAPDLLDAEQFSKVKKFKEWCFQRGIVQTFSNEEEFRRVFRSQLEINLNTHPYLRGILEQQGESDGHLIAAAELSEDGQELLGAAADDPGGHIMALRTLGGQYIQVNGTTYGEPGNARSTARWEAALEELVNLGYLLPRGNKGEVFQVSAAGYNCIDRIREEAK